MDGSPDFDHIRRVRVQARTAYVYAHAHALGWYEGSKIAADHAWNFLIGPGFAGGDFTSSTSRGCAHLVTGDGQIHDDMRDCYAQAFVLLAGAWRYRAFKDEDALKVARQTLDFLNTQMKAENGGWIEALPKSDGPRRQNPHMHLFESFNALYDATGDKVFLSHADDMFDLFKAHFWDRKNQALLEFFTADWQPHGDGGPIEPGHMMEWCWILREYQRLSGKDVSHFADPLFQRAIEYGWNESLGLLCDATNLDGSPHTQSLRSWPQTELIKASIAQARYGDTSKLRVAAEAITALFDRYLDVPVKGGWADKLNPQGDIISTTMPTSTFYHLFCAAAEADKLSEHIQSTA